MYIFLCLRRKYNNNNNYQGLEVYVYQFSNMFNMSPEYLKKITIRAIGITYFINLTLNFRKKLFKNQNKSLHNILIQIKK